MAERPIDPVASDDAHEEQEGSDHRVTAPMTSRTEVKAPKKESDSPRPGEITLLGVGRLAEVIGSDEARRFFDERDERRRFLYSRAVQRWSSQAGVGGRMTYRRRRAPS